MKDEQRLWWEQAKSDHAIFLKLKGAHECHRLHYLQMATEKLSKAYFWLSGHAPPKVHAGLVRFLKALLDRPAKDLAWIARSLGFERSEDLEKWVSTIKKLASDLQNIAPAEAQNGPNPEYPWPHENPVHYPAGHEFALWKELFNTGQGRKLIEFVSHAITRFDRYA